MPENDKNNSNAIASSDSGRLAAHSKVLICRGLDSLGARPSLPTPNQESPRLLRFYDLETQTVSFIPEEETMPGMIEVHVQGVEGLVWIDSKHLNKGEYQHAALSEEMQNEIRLLKASLDEVCYQSVAEWEDQFRRDMKPEVELATWNKIARIYEKFTSKRQLSLDQKKEVFTVLLMCTMSPRDAVFRTLPKLTAISNQQAEGAIEAFYE